jgi:hypothetical protein
MRIRILSLLALLALVYPSTARAGTITIQTQFIGVPTGYVFEGPRYPETGGVVLGSVIMSGGSADLAPELQGTFEAYCVDINGPIFFPGIDGNPPQPYDVDTTVTMTGWSEVGGLNTTEAGQRAAWLYNTYASTFGNTQLLERTALQMAIWEVLYDEIPNVIQGSPGAGSFAVATENADVAAQASVYLGQMLLDTAGVSASNAAWLQLAFTDANGTTDVQDFIGPLSSPPASVPEPGAGLLLGTGIAALAAFRSRKSLRPRA